MPTPAWATSFCSSRSSTRLPVSRSRCGRCPEPSTRAASTPSRARTSSTSRPSWTTRSWSAEHALGGRPQSGGRLTLVGSAVAVDDAAAIEVVRRPLDLHAVAGVDADPVAAHLAGGVADGRVAIVEDDLELAALVRLDDLAFHLDLLFLVGYVFTSFRGDSTERARTARAPSILPAS